MSHDRSDRGAVIQPPPVHPGVVLGLAVVGISIAAPLVRLSQAPAVVVALWRLAFSLVVVGVALALSGQWREWRKLRTTELFLATIAGVALAGHFWSWNASVHLTTIAASVTLVCLQPAIIVLISAVYLHERPTPRQLAGISIALAGALTITLPDLLGDPAVGAGPPNPLLGNLLALLGAVLASVYYVIGRRVRAELGIWSYVGIAYTACSVALLVAALLTRAPIAPQPPPEILIFAGLAIGPMLLGHTGMNWALRYRPAYVVNLTVLAEPLGASLIAASLPLIAETPPAMTVAGGAIVLTGLAIAVARR
jgi:drug/metabolite transporter (DMT)-like permease